MVRFPRLIVQATEVSLTCFACLRWHLISSTDSGVEVRLVLVDIVVVVVPKLSRPLEIGHSNTKCNNKVALVRRMSGTSRRAPRAPYCTVFEASVACGHRSPPWSRLPTRGPLAPTSATGAPTAPFQPERAESSSSLEHRGTAGRRVPPYQRCSGARLAVQYCSPIKRINHDDSLAHPMSSSRCC